MLQEPDAWNRLPKWHHFCVKLIVFFVELLLSGRASQRCVSRALQQILGRLFGKQLAIPCANTGRLWVLRLGLFELTRPKEKGDDWVWIVDHTIQISSVKCLLIVGCRLDRWARDRRPLEHHDLAVLALEPVEKSSGEIVCQQFQRTAELTGVPRAIVSDGGSDLRRGAAFFREQHPNVVSCYDIAHKMALFLKLTRHPTRPGSLTRLVKRGGIRSRNAVGLRGVYDPSPTSGKAILVFWASRARWRSTSAFHSRHGRLTVHGPMYTFVHVVQGR